MNNSSKIKSLDELKEIIAALKKQGKVIIHCHGVFDLLHPGHIKHFEAAKDRGDILVVTLTRDEYVNKGPGRPVFNHHLRADSIAAIGCVDFVAINEWPTAVETIKKLRPNFYVKGSDYADKKEDITGKIEEEEAAVKSVGGQLHFTNEISFSSSLLVNTFFAPHPPEAKEFLLDFRRRYSTKDIAGIFRKLAGLKVLVVGDIIIDEYHYCMGVGKSQKDNIIATRYLNEEVFAGGVLAAANHIAGFIRQVTLLSCIGTKNNYGEFIRSHLKPNIKARFFERSDSPTVVKRRFVEPSFLTKLFEVCYLENNQEMPKDLEDKIYHYLKLNLGKFDLVLVTDFGHGLITKRIVEILSREAAFLAVNVQTNSANLGFNLITKFPRADYVCIDEEEIRLACHDRVSELKDLILEVSRLLKCKKIIITRGHRGSLAYSKAEGFKAVPVFSTQILDRVGAGDAFFSLTSPCVFSGASMEASGFIGNAVGATKVLIVGNRSSVEPVPLFKYIATMLK